MSATETSVPAPESTAAPERSVTQSPAVADAAPGDVDAALARSAARTAVPESGQFFSRARNRASQWEGHGLAPASGSAAYGARTTPDFADAGGTPASRFHEAAGFGYGYTPTELDERFVSRARGDAPERDLADRPRRTSGAPLLSTQPAGREGRRARWRREPLAAREIMTQNPTAAHLETTVREVAEIMRAQNTGIVPVVDNDNRLRGVVTDRDIVMRSIAEGKDPATLRARDLMTSDVDAATPEEPLRDVVRLMGDKQVRRVPVVDRNDTLVGIISMADVATRADYDTDLQDALEEISSTRSFWSRLFG